MIQRKQTLFLLAVLIISITLFFLPFLNLKGHLQNVKLLSVFEGTINTIYPFLLNSLILIFSGLSIFLFKNRPLQYKFSNFIALLNVFLTGLFFLLSYNQEPLHNDVSYTFIAFLPLLSASFAFLAANHIKKDEQLVRNSDRIR